MQQKSRITWEALHSKLLSINTDLRFTLDYDPAYLAINLPLVDSEKFHQCLNTADWAFFVRGRLKVSPDGSNNRYVVFGAFNEAWGAQAIANLLTPFGTLITLGEAIPVVIEASPPIEVPSFVPPPEEVQTIEVIYTPDKPIFNDEVELAIPVFSNITSILTRTEQMLADKEKWNKANTVPANAPKRGIVLMSQL